MGTTEDQDYAEEHDYLAETILFLDKEIESKTNQISISANNWETARALHQLNKELIERYTRVRPRPYIGRVDFAASDGRQIQAYVGTDHIPNYVYSWTAPFPGELYYSQPSTITGYKAPEGWIAGKITLQRQYAIENSKLLYVTDVYRAVQEGVAEPLENSSQELLKNLLTESRGGEMQQAVASLRHDQYQQIAAAREQVMIIQGVAGSGKSLVGLHRIAFLLSPFNQRPDKIDKSKVIFFGPSEGFLRYVGNLLPSLNVQDLKQVTVREWLTNTLTSRVTIRADQPLMERLLRRSGHERLELYEVARVKGSLQLARAFDKAIRKRRRQFLDSSTPIFIPGTLARATKVHVHRVRQLLRKHDSGPINEQRSRGVELLINELWETGNQRDSEAIRTLFPTAKEFFESDDVRREVIAQVSSFWPHLDFRQEYRRLLTDESVLSALPNEGITVDLKRAILESLTGEPNAFLEEDLAALCYLDHLLNQHNPFGFQHVVIDEAQEISPIELLLIRLHSRDDSFTILGDLTQSLVPQGINRWREVIQLFNGASISRYMVRGSYRSTKDLTDYSNRVLKKANPSAVTAIPFSRRGERPILRSSRRYKTMVHAITDDIQDLKMKGAKTIAVICKTLVDAKRLQKNLTEAGVEDVALFEERQPSSNSVVVAPVYLLRGLEYDGVIVANAGADQYPEDRMHARLLYLAISRAAHMLRIHFIGAPSPNLH